MSKEFLKYQAGILSIFLVMYCVIDFFEKNTRYFPKYNARKIVIVEYYLTQLPKLALDILPFTVLFAAVITFWILARSGEIAVLRAAGCSIYRVSLPLLIWGFVFSGVSFALSEFVVPRTSMHLRTVETVKIENEKLDKMFLESTWVRGVSSFLRYGKFNSLEKILENPEYFIFNQFGIIQQFVHAQKAFFSEEEGRWILQNAVLINIEPGTSHVASTLMPIYRTTVYSYPPRLLREGISHEELSYQQLKSLIRESKEGGGAIAEREIDLYMKLSLPLSNFIFVFFAVPFAVRRERSSENYFQMIIIIAWSLAYWLGNEFVKSFNLSLRFSPPMVAAWLVNILFFMIGLWILRRTNRPG